LLRRDAEKGLTSVSVSAAATAALYAMTHVMTVAITNHRGTSITFTIAIAL